MGQKLPIGEIRPPQGALRALGFGMEFLRNMTNFHFIKDIVETVAIERGHTRGNGR
jgi:hypothetical protein